MNDRPTIKSIALTTVIGFNLRMKLQVGKVLPLDRNDMYQMIKTSEGSNGQPGLFFVYFRSLQTTFELRSSEQKASMLTTRPLPPRPGYYFNKYKMYKLKIEIKIRLNTS